MENLLKRHRIRRLSAEEVVEKLGVQAFTVAPGVIGAAQQHIEVLFEQLRLVSRQLKECDKRMAQALAGLKGEEGSEAGPPREPSDAAILLSLPGVGNLVAATVLTEAGGQLSKVERSTLRARCGTAPVTRRSGKQLQVGMRYACHERLREACHFWGSSAVQNDRHAAAHYQRLRARGCNHARAVRGVVDRLIDVLVAMQRERTVYDPERRGKRLRGRSTRVESRRASSDGVSPHDITRA